LRHEFGNDHDDDHISSEAKVAKMRILVTTNRTGLYIMVLFKEQVDGYPEWFRRNVATYVIAHF
jgi:hypothetical protein